MHLDDSHLLNAREKINRAALDDMRHLKDDWGIDVVSYEGASATALQQATAHARSCIATASPITLLREPRERGAVVMAVAFLGRVTRDSGEESDFGCFPIT